MKVLIVGAGIAGLSAALALQDTHDVTIIEKRPQQQTIGYLIGLWATTQEFFEEIGVGEAIKQVSTLNPSFSFRSADDQEILHINMGTEHKNSVIGHQKLREILENKLQQPVQYSQTVTKIIEREKEASVTCNTQTNSYDLVIGADGIHSWIRENYFDAHKQPIGWSCHWAQIPRMMISEATALEMLGAGAVLGMYGSTQKYSVAIATLPTHENLDRELEQFTGVGKEIAQHMKQVHETQLFEIQCEQPHTKRIVLIGDAAHGMPPFAGIGATMAIEDAWVLAQELTNNVEESLQQYVKRRTPRWRLAKKQTHQQHLWKNIQNPLLAKIRNIVAPHIPVKHFMKRFEQLVSQNP